MRIPPPVPTASGHPQLFEPLVLAGIALLTTVTSTGATPKDGPLSPEPMKAAIASYGRLPLYFEANRGQTDEQVRFLARGSGYGLFLTATESVLILRRPQVAGAPKPSLPHSSVLRLKLLGASPRPAMEGRQELPSRSQYFIGSDPSKWHTDVPHYARVNYKDVYPGVSLTYYGDQSQLEYDFVVRPGGNPGLIRLGIEGADEIRVDAEGDLALSMPGGEVVERAPFVYQEVDGGRKVVEGRFVLHGRDEVGFKVGAYEPGRPLVIDPVLVYSTYLGGSGVDVGLGIAVDASGSAYVTGYTSSADFPTVKAVQAGNGQSYDAFIVKLDATASALVYATYLGGSDFDLGTAIAVDASGNAYVTGYTGSIDFPTAHPFQATNRGEFVDAFVAKLNAKGSALAYSTYLGGIGDDEGLGIAVDASQNAYVTGVTTSPDFPTSNPIQASNGSAPCEFCNTDAFVVKLNAKGSALVYSTYLGGSNTEKGVGIAVDASGNAYVAGDTASSDFPTANPVQALNGSAPCFFCGADAFVAKLDAAGSSFEYSTYLGGTADDYGLGVAIDASGNAYVTGNTGSNNFPTANALQAENASPCFGIFCGLDAFVTKLNPAGSALVYSTYLGGSSYDGGVSIAVDGSGNAYITGDTASDDFPTVDPLPGSAFAFVAKVNSTGSDLVYSTYLGGSGADRCLGIAVDASANAYVTGWTSSTDFPTVHPLQASNAGILDAFVAKLGEEAAPSGSDLVETALSSPPAVVFLKEKFSVTETVQNQGSGSARHSSTRYYMSHDTVKGASDMPFEKKRQVPRLAAGDASTGTITLKVAGSTSPGVYYLLACADDTALVDEADETNNCLPAATTVEVRAQDRDDQ